MSYDQSSDFNDFQNENDSNAHAESVNKTVLSKKRERRKKKEEKEKEKEKKMSTRKIVNFPATQPYIRLVDGEERLCFKYNTKISETALSTMGNTNVLDDYEFCVRFDLDTVDINKLSEKFKIDNCIYPRANCEKEEYKGNRWVYETECNRLAWQFVSLNPVLLYGKKGLIQRAVDTYRNSMKEARKKSMKEEKIVNGVMRRRYNEVNNTTVIYYTLRGSVRKVRIRIDIENVNYDLVTEEFKNKYAVFEEEYDDQSFGKEKYELRNPDNEIGIRLAWLNIENTSFWNAVKHTDRAFMLKKAVEGYKEANFSESTSDERDIGLIVSSLLEDTAVKNNDADENFYFLD